MDKIPKRFLGIAGSAVTIFLLAGLTFVVFNGDGKPAPALVFDFRSNTPTMVEVFFNRSLGFEKKYSSRESVPRQSSWREMRLDLPKARIRRLRLDPADNTGTFGIRNLRVVDADGTVRLLIPPAKIRPANQILSMSEHNGELEIQTPPGANDPQLEIPFERTIDLRGGGWRSAFLLAGWVLLWAAVVVVVYYAPRFLQKNAIFLALCRKPTAVIWLAAITGTLLSTSPVAFQGKSFMSPNNGDGGFLFYDGFPTLPNYSDSATEDVDGADIGAMAWQHFPLTVAQEHAVKDFGEFPLWNRYNSAGTTMIGQGQMMLGDPLDWVMWLVGVDAATFDAKFLLLRSIFAVSLGLSVLVITRAIAPSAMVAIAAPFVGYFIYRVNHAAIFTLCYAPLISLAWLKLTYAEDERFRLRWVAGLMLANWLVMNSGTVKEAYMSIAVLNAVGMLHFIVEKPRFGPKFKPWFGLLVASGVCFLMIASPVLGTFFDTMRSGTSLYDSPGIQQYPFWFFLGFVDNFFYLLRTDSYSPAVNALLFVGFLLGIVRTPRLERLEARRSAVVLALGCGILIAIAFGVIPEKLLLFVPFVGNVQHVDATFSTILIVPVSILAGIGFAGIDPQKTKRVEPIVVLVLIVLVFLFVLSFAQRGGLRLKQFAIYSTAVLPAAMYAPWLAMSLLNGRLSFSGIGVCLIAILLVLGRGAMYGDSPDRFVFNPHERVSLTYRPPLVDRLMSKLRGEPTRIVGLGSVLMPGYNATLGLENISGPDAMHNRRYRELTAALKLPYIWGWRLVFNQHDLVTCKNALDFLGVGFILSSVEISEAGDAKQVDDDGSVFAYSRRNAWPRAFYTDRVILYDNAQSLAERISTGDGRPFVAVTQRSVDSNTTLRQLVEKHAPGSATIVAAKDYTLTNNSTSFTIEAPAAGVLYLGETDEPGDFIATVNGKRVPYLTANHAFKAVVVDKPGQYRVTFRYWPSHLTAYLWLAFGGLVLWLTALMLFWKRLGKEGGGTALPVDING